MEDFTMFVLVLALIVLLEGSRRIRDDRKEIIRLREKAHALLKEKLIWERAHMAGLMTAEAKDLHNLVFYLDRGDADNLQRVFKTTSEKVREVYFQLKDLSLLKEHAYDLPFRLR